MDPNAVFITGIPRCGSSWIGGVLAAASRSRYVYEPFNAHWVRSLEGRIAHFRYLPARVRPRDIFEEAVRNAFSGRQSPRQLARAAYRGYWRDALRSGPILVKDPTACLMADWIDARVDTRTVVIHRHPCGFAASLEALGWDFRPERLLRQKRLMKDHLEPCREALRNAGADPWRRRGVFWGAVHRVLLNQRQHHPDWVFCAYEAFCADPVNEFQRLASRLSMTLDDDTLLRRTRPPAVHDDDSGSTQKLSARAAEAWRRSMTTTQQDEVMDAVHGVLDPRDLDVVSITPVSPGGRR